jgi:hypothetical protein
MGIYGVKSNTCNCKGSWASLTNDHRVYMEKPCYQHILKEGNIIYYQLIHILNEIINTRIGIIKEKYPVKLLKIEDLGKGTKIIKVEVKHEGELNTDNFNINKQMYFSQMNDESMWEKIDDNTFNFILLYNGCHHTVEDKWEPSDY